MTLRIATAAIGLLLATAGTPVTAQEESVRREMAIATATPTGNYFSIGNAICRVLQRQGLYLETGDVTLLGCGASATSGSLQNVELLRTRAVDFALVQSDVAFNAFYGSGRFEGRRVSTLRSLLSLNQEAFQVLAGRGTGVTIWSDLRGKKVNLGPVGTTSYTMFRELFEMHNLDEKWLGQTSTIPVTTHTIELCEGNIEVLGQTTGVPNVGLADAARRCGANVVSLDTPQIRGYVSERPYYTPVIIPRGTYAGQLQDVRTFGVLATLVATTDTPDIAAYSIVRAVFEGLDEIKAMQPVLAGVIPERMIKDGLSAPLHPGAIRYYRERGWLKELEPEKPVSLGQTVDALASAATATPAQAAPALVPPTVSASSPPTTGTTGKIAPRLGNQRRTDQPGKGRSTAGP